MNIGRKAVLNFICLSLVSGFARSQPADPRFTPDQDAMIQTVTQAALDQATIVLMRHPPRIPEPPERKLALISIDQVLHDIHAHQRAPVHEFYQARMDEAMNEIEQTEVASGAVIWKMYNHGFIVRTSKATIAFDVVGGGSADARNLEPFHDFRWRIAEECDALFVTNERESHGDPQLMKEFATRGKPIVAMEGLWKDKDFHSAIVHFPREPHKLHSLKIRGGESELKVAVYPGHHADMIENNVYLVTTPDGITLLHTGDQFHPQDVSWISEIDNHFDVDVMMANCWMPDLNRTVAAVRPKLLLPGHENELGHPLERRDSYAATYRKLRGIDLPAVVMTWGESIQFGGGGH